MEEFPEDPNEFLNEEEEEMVGKEIDITGDGGIKKTIIKKGEGYKKPGKGAKVSVQYTGRLEDGTIFDKSKEAFIFELGIGQVIKGWDEGVSDMKKGEKSLFILSPNYAYGEHGSPPKIPPNSTLHFEIELISWQDEKDLSDDKDGSIMKRVIKEGEWSETVTEETKVKINVKGIVDDKTQYVFQDVKDFEFIIGENKVPACLETVVESMKTGECCIATIQPHAAFGEEGNKEMNIPRNATVKYEVEMINLEKPKASYDMNPEEKFSNADQRKNMGNDFFKQKQFSVAKKKYLRGLTYLDNEYKMSDEEKLKAKNSKIPFYLNIAACDLQLGILTGVLEYSQKVLDIDPDNVKALFRKGKALSLQNEWNDAFHVLKQAFDIDSKSFDIKKEFLFVKKKIALQDQKDRKVFKNMFTRLAKLEEKEEKEKDKEKDVVEKEKDEKDNDNDKDKDKDIKVVEQNLEKMEEEKMDLKE